MGRPEPRVDGRLKVTGNARYASDFPVANPAHACLVTSAIAKGRIVSFDLDDARAVPGVLDILTHETVGNEVHEPKFFGSGGTASTIHRPLSSAQISHAGQIVAIVVADTYEAAREAAYRVRVTYEEEDAATTLDSDGVETLPATKVRKEHKNPRVGDAAAALRAAPVTIDAVYETPTQHHNAIELYATTCVWSGEQLTVYEPSQFVHALKHAMAEQLGIDAEDVRVISPYVGGAFGSKAAVTPRTALVAIAARRLNRPVKLVATRAQGFTIATYRAETRHRVRLGAQRDGKLTAYVHEGWEATSRLDDYLVGGTETTAHIYDVPNVSTRVNVVRTDRATPGFMRSPPEVPYVFALETALDELAEALDMDPIELRRINDTRNDPITGAPYTSRSLMACYDEASRAFGWRRRNLPPGSMRDGDWLVGWGCATAVYPTFMGAATARVRLARNGATRVEIAAHDLGTGAYTAIAQTAAERLGLPVAAVEVLLGDSALPAAPVAGGSNTTASCCNVVAKACDGIRRRLVRAAMRADRGPLRGRKPSSVNFVDRHIPGEDGAKVSLADAFDMLGAPMIEEYAHWLPHGMEPDALKKLHLGSAALTGGAMEDRIAAAFGAELVELRVNVYTGELRVPRIVGAFAAGRIVNPRTAHSQYVGGMIWGIASALHEQTELDRRVARYVNTDLAEYLIPVNADVPDVQAILVSEEDRLVNPLGIKGLGELANVGTAAALGNALYHATGRRIRKLPLRIEDVL